MIINRFKNLFSTMQKQFMENRQDCLDRLKLLEIPYKLVEHEAVFNMEELSKVKLDKAPFIKNIFYSSQKKANTFYFIVAQTNTKIEKAFWKTVGISHNNVRGAKEEDLNRVLRVKKGSVNPFALSNDQKKQVQTLVIDENLDKFEYLSFHPMDNTATVEILKNDFYKFLDHQKISYQKLNLSEEIVKVQEVKKEKGGKGKQKQQVNLLGVDSKKNQKFSSWYQEVIIRAEMLEYYDVSGCYILRPWAYGIWEKVQAFFDSLIKERGVQNSYFPMFVSKKSLQTEKDHVEGFSAEVAWVTKSGKSDLAEPIAIRPTSQTIMYPAYSKWIKSHRDLPLKLNQWTNIVRWEFKHPTPFIRTRQFLWQEGHTAHATFEDAEEETFANLQFYRRVYEQLLAVPVYKGIKTASEKFAGGFKTTTIQTWIPQNGRAIQAATSHNLGQNFAKMFDIEFQDEKKQKKYVWQTSWGITTRSIGILIMHHGDDKGLVLPPKVANVQVVIIPLPFKGKQADINKVAEKLFFQIKKAKIRVHLDDRDNYTPGWKYNHWQLKGVPIRLELGPKDIEKQELRCVVRHSGEKFQISWATMCESLEQNLQKIQKDMYLKAKERFHDKEKKASNWAEFLNHLNNRNVVLTPWCENEVCEQKVKERSGKESKEIEGENVLAGQAKTLCVPLEYEPLKENEKCFHCEELAKVRVFWGRSY